MIAVGRFGDKEGSFKREDWKYSVGRITQEMFLEHLFPSGDNRLAMFCGPPPMIKFAADPFCKKMGYTDDQIVIF